MKKCLPILVLSIVLMAIPAFAGPTIWHVHGTVVGIGGNFTGAIGGSVGSTYAATHGPFGFAQASNGGGGSGFGVNFPNASFAKGGSGGESHAASLGWAQSEANQTNFGAGAAIKGFAIGGVVSGGAFGF